ncbi:MAG: FAD-dependent oxidoreductase [Lachnospiraceae bacterium]|nr:FAD-dependent oxidoreductase [Lachnospiraceae bacterium]
MKEKCDVAIIGAGILGCFAARALSRFDLKVFVLEKKEDVCTEITRANTGIIYQGYDQHFGSLKADMCKKASESFPELCRSLEVPYRQSGLLMLSEGPNGEQSLEKKWKNSQRLNLSGVSLISGADIKQLEPFLQGDFSKALFAKNTYTVNPWALGIAAYEDAVSQGTSFFFRQEVTDILRGDEGFFLQTREDCYQAKRVICCGGLWSDKLWEMANQPKVRIIPDGADYLIFDTKVGNQISHIISFETENKKDGLTLVPTVDGNIMAGPSKRKQMGERYGTEQEELVHLLEQCERVLPALTEENVIRSFGALRPNPFEVIETQGKYEISDSSLKDFVILEEEDMLALVGVKTPGLTCASQLGEYICDWTLRSLKRDVPQKKTFFRERRSLPKQQSGEIICKCNQVTAEEIRKAIADGAYTLDGIKRRTGALMGRCQGGSCMADILKILEEETKKEETKACTDVPFRKKHYEVAIIGGGAAGMAAALSAQEKGLSVLLIDRKNQLGGILLQCRHQGFGLGYFGENLSGIEYAHRFEERIQEASKNQKQTFTLLLNTTVLCVKEDKTLEVSGKTPSGTNFSGSLSFDRLILATGCREKSVHSLLLSGTRPSGIFTSGTAQKMLNVYGKAVGEKIVILGTGDIGQIVARDLILAGKKIVAMIEKESEIGGLKRNREQCIENYQIPVFLNSQLVRIYGEETLEGIEVLHKDSGISERINCDTLLTAMGLIPDRDLLNENFKEDYPDWISATGNCDYVHEIVDGVSKEAEQIFR